MEQYLTMKMFLLPRLPHSLVRAAGDASERDPALGQNQRQNSDWRKKFVAKWTVSEAQVSVSGDRCPEARMSRPGSGRGVSAGVGPAPDAGFPPLGAPLLVTVSLEQGLPTPF